MCFRFVDRDMLMRYHWGLGVGHIYSHGQRADAPSEFTDRQTISTAGDEDSVNEEPPNDDNASDAENPELGFDNREDDWIDIEEGSEDELEEEDEIIVAMDDMYGSI
jgi:hypothetical protein